ncbi:hypothetical protein AAMO2058_000465900 [Amorphochlora amoebiformis]
MFSNQLVAKCTNAQKHNYPTRDRLNRTYQSPASQPKEDIALIQGAPLAAAPHEEHSQNPPGATDGIMIGK